MSFTSHLFRAAIVASVLAPAAAHAQPRGVVIKDFDGPRTLADSGRDAVMRILAASYDIVSAKRWTDAKNGQRGYGPESWKKAANKAGVGAVIEGWVQDEGRNKVLSLLIFDASDGHQLDQLVVKLPSGNVTDEALRQLKKGLDDRLKWIDAVTVDRDLDVEPQYPVEDPRSITKSGGGAAPSPSAPPPAPPPRDQQQIGPEVPPTGAAPASTTRSLEPPKGGDWPIPELPARASYWTPRFFFGGGPGYFSRSLAIGAEFPEGVTQYASVPHKSLAVDAAFYPFPREKANSVATGPGFSFAIGKSVGSVVTFDDTETVGDYSINQHAWNADFHYRVALGQFAIDGALGYGQNNYKIIDAPEEFEVPDTSYQYLSAGATVDLSITDRSSVGFGAKYLHVLDQGDLTSVEWYGPGRSSGFQLAGNFVIPLPKNLYVRGDLQYTRFKTTFDGVGAITEEEGVFEAVDSTVGGTVKVGVSF